MEVLKLNTFSRNFLVIVMMAITLFTPLVKCGNLMDKIRDDAELSQFYELLERNAVANVTIRLRSVTLFVPTNQAFQRYAGNRTYVLYHILTVAATLDQLGPSVLTDMEGNPPLYITRRKDRGHEDVYVNNALIIKSRSNVHMMNDEGKKQVMHVIDDVLQPLTVNPTSSLEIFNPDAFQFLTHSDSLDISGHRIRSYRQRVIMMKKESVYQSVGGHTFLIPIEEGFKPSPRPELIDRKVIDGHVIPDNVIFTSSADLDAAHNTLAAEDNIRVRVSFFSQKDGPITKMYVKSNTIVGDSKHATGVVLAEIVRANIPVKNGVVHLIHRPLMIIDTTVTQFLKTFKIVNEKEDGPLYKFYEVIMDAGGQFMEDINNLTDVTILAPSNEAWSQPTVDNVIRNKTKMREILNLHIIRDRLNVEKINHLAQNTGGVAQVATNAMQKFVYFRVTRERNETQVYLEANGVDAKFVQSDIAQINGYIHIIDRVLGIPYRTVLGKLEQDRNMNMTKHLGDLSKFNSQLDDTTRRYTYFVPRDEAWKKIQTEFPSAHKKLFMRDFTYHTKAILERHLVIADHIFKMSDLIYNDTNSVVLPTIRDSLRIRVRADAAGYSILWNNKLIHVYRPDIECTNGIIHVIDAPFLEERDIRVNGGTQAQMTLSILFANLLMILIAKVLL